MSHQVPSGRVAETRDFAGPFLRFNSGTGPGEEHWTGSVLCLTRQREGGEVVACPTPVAAAAEAAAPRAPFANGGQLDAARDAPSGAEDGHERPVLILADRSRGAPAAEQRITPVALDCCLGWTFWRFDLRLHLTEAQRPVQYSVAVGERGSCLLCGGKR